MADWTLGGVVWVGGRGLFAGPLFKVAVVAMLAGPVRARHSGRSTSAL